MRIRTGKLDGTVLKGGVSCFNGIVRNRRALYEMRFGISYVLVHKDLPKSIYRDLMPSILLYIVALVSPLSIQTRDSAWRCRQKSVISSYTSLRPLVQNN